MGVYVAERQFADRREAGRELAAAIPAERVRGGVVVGLARGGVVVAAEVASALGLPLDVVAVRKVGHPWQPEYAIGAVAPGDGVYLRDHHELSEQQLTLAVGRARRRAAALDAALHADAPPIPLTGRACLLVDDGLATGATMIAAARWARTGGAAAVIAAVPVAARQSVPLVEAEVDTLVCPHVPDDLWAVGLWYRDFEQVDDAEVRRILATV